MAIILDSIKKVTGDLSALSVDDDRISEKVDSIRVSFLPVSDTEKNLSGISEKLKSINKSAINKMNVIEEKVNQIKSIISSIKDTTQVISSKVQSYAEKSDSLLVSIKGSMEEFTSLISVLKIMFYILVGVGLFTLVSVIGILIYLFYKNRKMCEEGYIQTD